MTLEKIVDAPPHSGLARYAANTLAATSISHPLHAIIETGIVRMSDAQSIASRGTATLLIAGGIGSLYEAGRRLSLRQYGLTEESSQRTLAAHDTKYAIAFCAGITPPLLYAMDQALGLGLSGEQIAISTMLEAVYGMMAGAAIGPAMAVAEEALGVQEHPRLPARFRKLGKNAKRGILVGVLAGSLALTGAIYKAMPDSWQVGWSTYGTSGYPD